MEKLVGVQTITHFIGGEMKPGTSGRFGKVFKPSTGEVMVLCPYASAEEVNETVAIAKNAFAGWKKTPVAQRVEIIHRFRSLLVEKTEELAQLIGLESGKTISDAKGEISRGLESVDLAINAPHLLKGEYSVNVGGEINAYSIKQPLGVVTAISPFNFPFMVPVAMATMAVACGNAVILKPSEKVPNSALFFSKLWKEAGLPDGVWNVVNGDKEAVDALLKHPDVPAVSFVGSTRIAQYIYEEGCRNHKRVAAFGGGKNHMIIMPDANLDHAVNSFLGAAYGAASQRCMAISAAVPVGEKTAEAFVAKLKRRVQDLKVGAYNDTDADFGALISQESKETVIKYIEQSLQEGAELCVDGRHPEVPHSQGFYLGATLLDHVTPDMQIYREEVFGPARIVVRVNSLDEAIELINNHEYGNGVTIFTNNGYAGRTFAEQIEVGMVGINVPIPIPVGYHNFGGWKRSKFGESHMFGPDTARFFTKSKTISERWPENDIQHDQVNFDFPSNR
ncbi:CoA-acylating methylmalonate-semialdehyde dehydrogenase [Pseudobacillus badius]|uniref:CoA-acylating methylmalonate-semialdehyde dehydrogenase n=1 Tax=Bacillus badius TaxID=1455 RepID=UPI0007B0B6B7|nr:CoA-acylating methylmalonate-semialdehyde dehydrogenase [Bacillus badius]KZN98323.1 methylmalonate-semialdehyde dehydrogenase (acylating) [Bacillus badius]OCS82693.1 methylmalonate-semialdehyde dehydrogenase (acylating) [Bacillus badius]OVE51399.1 methylmalonate-semialdehyde dehydrogenase (CoA acylating) [Bacillus badius]TDW02500.1 malonate-semialdehyde dehydrogenase (acetylating)/methylmalonate-semialdehyde dehydrogenase [Bacillus badius]